MENIDEDIKRLENLIGFVGCDIRQIEADSIERVLSRLKTAERMNDVLADEVEDLYSYLVEEYGCFSVDYSKDTENTSKQEILEWARKKVEDEVC